MPGEVIDRPNPKAKPSHIPDLVEQLQVQLQQTSLNQSANDGLLKFRRAAAYIAAGEIALILSSFLRGLSCRSFGD